MIDDDDHDLMMGLYERSFSDGDKLALMTAVRRSLLANKPLPKWAEVSLCEAIRQVERYEAASGRGLRQAAHPTQDYSNSS